MAFMRSFTLLAFLAATVVASPYPSPKSGPDSCSKNHFWYDKKATCLPHGGISHPPAPPRGKKCPPTNWYWHSEKSCCVPTYPQPRNPPPPQCYGGYEWNHATQCCEPGTPTPPYSPPPKPSKAPNPPYNPPSYNNKASHSQSDHKHKRNDEHGHAKRSHAEMTATYCPSSHTACPINSLRGGEYECVDTTVELSSCGGCSSMGQGQDCTAIPGAWNVGCEAGVCAVYTCALGYRVSQDGVSCELL